MEHVPQHAMAARAAIYEDEDDDSPLLSSNGRGGGADDGGYGDVLKVLSFSKLCSAATPLTARMMPHSPFRQYQRLAGPLTSTFPSLSSARARGPFGARSLGDRTIHLAAVTVNRAGRRPCSE